MCFLAKVICLIACHVYLAEPFAKKFQDRHIPNVTSFDKEQVGAADKIAKGCSQVASVMTDVGHPFNAQIHRTLAQLSPEVLTIAYYDNPESYVPEGYSRVAAEVMTAAKNVLFANANLAQMKQRMTCRSLRMGPFVCPSRYPLHASWS